MIGAVRVGGGGIADGPEVGTIGTWLSAEVAVVRGRRSVADRFRIPVEQAEMASSPGRPSKAENLGEGPDWLGLRRQLVKRARSQGGRGDAEDLAQEAVLRVLIAMRSKALSDPARYAIRAVDRLRVDRWRKSRLVLEEPLLPEELAGRCKATEFAWLEARRCLHQATLDSGFSPLEAAVFVSVRFDGAAWREACAEIGLEGKGAVHLPEIRRASDVRPSGETPRPSIP